MRRKTLLAAVVLGALTLAAGCSGADSLLDPQSTPGGGSPPSTVDAGGQNLDGTGAVGELGSR